MRWVILCAIGAVLIGGGQVARAAHPKATDNDVYLGGPAFKVGSVSFTIPAKWLAGSSDNPARVGQWQVPPPHGTGENGEVVVLYFGPGLGGTAKDNIDLWTGLMTTVDGHPAKAEVKSRQIGSFKISQVVIFGTYSQVVPQPGVPPRPRPGFGLVGAVVETPQGNIYWRFTGPEPLVTANLPLFTKIIDSIKPQDK